MSCYHPLKAFRTPHGVVFDALARHDIIGDVEIACGRCIGCRLRRSRDWALRMTHEAQLHERNSFLTLTYEDGQLPHERESWVPYGSLHYRDFQRFMKRLRKATGLPLRFFMCGEYGPEGGRPHFHANVFGWLPNDRKAFKKSGAGEMTYTSEMLSKLWRYGVCTVQPFTSRTAAYAARYVVDKVGGQLAESHYRTVDADGVIHQRVPEFSRCSLRPGIGARWFERFGRDVFPHDLAVADGVKYQVPKYYDRLAKRGGVIDWDSIEFKRQQRAKIAPQEQTDARRATRERVQVAKIRSLKRESL